MAPSKKRLKWRKSCDRKNSKRPHACGFAFAIPPWRPTIGSEGSPRHHGKHHRKGGDTTEPPREYPFRHPRRYPQPGTPKGEMHHKAGGGVENFSPEVGIESPSPTTEVEQENFEPAQQMDPDSEMEVDEAGNEVFAKPPNPHHPEPPAPQEEATSSNEEEPKILMDPECLEEDWGNFYQFCPRWKSTWVATHNPENPWPKGIKVHEKRMYPNERLCIPYALQNLWIRQSHEHLGHPGAEKLWKTLQTRVDWAKERDAHQFVGDVMSQCDTCQACQKIQNAKRPITHTPMPPKVMSSVAMDIFYMPPTKLNGKIYDVVVVCVDRHSGWMVAIKCQNKGLTGAKVAKKMLKHQWQLFGLPDVITSDQGSHFVSAWFQTLAGGLGIRQAF